MTRLAGAAIFTVLVLAAYGGWLFYVYHYTGELHQGSAAVKMEWRRYETSQLTVMGVALFTARMWGGFVLGAFLKVPALKWVLSGMPALMRSAAGLGERGLIHLLWIAPVALGLAYGLLLDWARSWYYLPGILTFTLLSAGGLAALLGWVGPDSMVHSARGPLNGRCAEKSYCPFARLPLLARKTAGLIGWAVLIESALVFGLKLIEERDPESEKIWALKMADWLEDNVEPGTRVGVWHSGIIGYYTPGLNVINLDGLNNNDILNVLRGRVSLNEYFDQAGLSIIVSKGRDKMGTFGRQWGRQRLIPWDKPPRRSNPAEPPSVEAQILPQFIQRIIRIEPDSAPATAPG